MPTYVLATPTNPGTANWVDSTTLPVSGGGGAPSGPAGGDLAGTYPNPDVVALQGNPVDSASLGLGDASKVMVWSGTEWVAQSVPGIAPTPSDIQLPPTPEGPVNLQEWLDTNWSPLLIPDLQLFLDSAVGVTLDGGGGIVTWQDRSPASRTFIQNDPARQPTLTPDALAGQPVVSFSGATPLNYTNSSWMRTPPGGTGYGISADGFTLVTVVRSDAPAILAGDGGYQQIIGTSQPAGPGWTYSTRGIYGLPQAQLAVTATTPAGFLGFGAGTQNYNTDPYAPPPAGRPGLWHISAVSINPTQDSSWVDHDDAVLPATITSTPFVSDPFAEGNFAGLIQYGDQPGQLLEIGRTTQADVRFILLFNRSLNADEMERLKSWLKAEINRDQANTHTRTVNGNVLYVSQSGNDSNRGANGYEPLATMAEAFNRLNNVPYYIEAGVPGQPYAGDSQTLCSRVLFVGPGVYTLPYSLSRVSNLMIAGTVELDHTFEIVSVTGGGSELHPLKIVINETVANDAWRGKQITTFEGGDTTTIPWNITAHRFTVAKNVDNGDGTTTLYVPAGPTGVALVPGVPMGLINHLTELVWEGLFSYIEIKHCTRLEIANCIIRNDATDDTNVTDGARCDVWNAYFVVAGVLWQKVNLMAAGGSHVVAKCSYIAPKGGGWNAFFFPMIRWGGIMESHSNVFDYRYSPQFRMQLAQGGLNFFNGQILRECQGVVFTAHTNYPPRGNVNVLSIQGVYGFWADQSKLELPPITFENRIDPGQDVMWDYAVSGGATVEINVSDAFVADPQTDLNTYPVNQTYRTVAFARLGGFAGVDTFLDPVESAVGPSNSTIYCRTPSLVGRTARASTNLTLANGWQGVDPVEGTWDANTNTPNLSALASYSGQMWAVTTAGATTLGGITPWAVGNYAVYSGGGVWTKSLTPPANRNAAPAVAKTASGQVQLRGVVAGGTLGLPFATLPAGLLPNTGYVGRNQTLVPVPMNFIAPSDAGAATITLGTNGDLTITSISGGTDVYLDSITWTSF
jgi:hypothetical protein